MAKINTTVKYGLVGENINYSFSKEIHQSIQNIDYQLINLNEKQFAKFFLDKDFLGVNVTIPYKKDVMIYLDKVSDEAKKIGAVNTVVNKNGMLYGYNTDYYGFKYLLSIRNIEVSGKNIAILGSGATSSTIKAVLEDLGAKNIVLVSRNKSKGLITYPELYRRDSVEIIVNATPVGTSPKIDKSPISLDSFNNLETVIDVVYNPIFTKLCLKAKDKGIKYTGGLYMLVAQAVYANGIFASTKIPNKKIETIYLDIIKKKLNIVLIGMPGCGKSTLAQYIAKAMNKELIDIDELITEKISSPIYEFLKHHDEKEFRDLETESIKAVSTKINSVIALGGGAVLNEENINILKHNSVILYVDCDIEDLEINESRPLSDTREKLQELYDNRIDLYNEYQDIKITNKGSIEKFVEKTILHFNMYCEKLK